MNIKKKEEKNGEHSSNGYPIEYIEYLNSLTEEERKIIRETKALKSDEIEMTPEERKRFREFIEIL